MPLAHDLDVFSDPWEHVHMLSDTGRNGALLTLLRRRAPDARVLEIGAGSGLWACAAARLGAKRVLAVEPTPMAEGIRELVERNGLASRVEVVQATIEELEPEPFDLVFSELLNVMPFAEGLLDTSRVARRWVAAGGHLAPSRLQVFAQAAVSSIALEAPDAARASVQGIGAELGLDLRPLVDFLDPDTLELAHGDVHRLVGEPVELWDLRLGTDDAPEPVRVSLPARREANAAVIWFRAELDEGLTLGNAPTSGGHWGQLVARGTALARPLGIHVEVDDDDLVVQYAP